MASAASPSPTDGLTPYEAARVMLLDRALLGSLGVSAISGLSVLKFPTMAWTVVFPVLFAAGCLHARRILRRGNRETAARWIVWPMLAIIMATASSLGGLMGPMPLYLCSLVVAAWIWVPRAEALVHAGLSAATLVTLVFGPPTDLASIGPAAGVVSINIGIASLEMALLVGLTVEALGTARADAGRRTAQALAERRAADDAARSRASFLAMMSHELRTPLNAVLGYAELLREDANGVEEDLDKITVAGRAMLRRVEQVLESARADVAELRPPGAGAVEAEVAPRLSLLDRLLLRSLVPILGVVGVAIVCAAAVPALHQQLPLTFGWGVLLAGATWLAARGWGRAVAPVLVGVGATVITLELAMGGRGPWSPAAMSAPLVVTITWSWLGRWPAGLVGLALGIGLTIGAANLTKEPYPLSVYLLQSASILGASLGFVAIVLDELAGVCHAAQVRTREAEAAVAEAHAANQARDRFMASISVDMRTPLQTILGYTEILFEDEPDGERREDLGRVRTAGKHLLRLLDDVLAFSEAQNAGLRFDLEWLDLREVVEEVVQATTALATGHGNTLQVVASAPLPPVEADRGRLWQILLNLISNANKYTNGGAIVLEVSRAKSGVAIAVRDEGIGIPAAKLDQLFQPFVQLHEGAERRPGIGLGLALSREFAERMGGTITAASTVGVGSTFTLVLPTPVRTPFAR